MEQFSNGAILKWSKSQMQHFGVATLCHISRSQEQRNMACDVLPSGRCISYHFTFLVRLVSLTRPAVCNKRCLPVGRRRLSSRPVARGQNLGREIQ